MTRTIGSTILALLIATSAFAQSAPDRRGEVAGIARAHPEMFGSDETRRDGLKIIVCGLNQDDGGNWGRLVKNDQGGKIPADIIVWRPTREHFDVLTDSGPNWGPAGVLENLAWQWSPVDCGAAAPPPPVVTPPPPAPPPTLPSNVELIALIEKILDSNQQVLAVAKDTNEHVKSMDRTLAQTLGSFSKFVAKYIAPAVGGYIMAKQIEDQHDTPAAAPAQ